VMGMSDIVMVASEMLQCIHRTDFTKNVCESNHRRLHITFQESFMSISEPQSLGNSNAVDRMSGGIAKDHRNQYELNYNI